MITCALSICTQEAIVLHPTRCYTSALYRNCNKKHALFDNPGRVLLWLLHTEKQTRGFFESPLLALAPNRRHHISCASRSREGTVRFVEPSVTYFVLQERRSARRLCKYKRPGGIANLRSSAHRLCRKHYPFRPALVRSRVRVKHSKSVPSWFRTAASMLGSE